MLSYYLYSFCPWQMQINSLHEMCCVYFSNSFCISKMSRKFVFFLTLCPSELQRFAKEHFFWDTHILCEINFVHPAQPTNWHIKRIASQRAFTSLTHTHTHTINVHTRRPIRGICATWPPHAIRALWPNRSCQQPFDPVPGPLHSFAIGQAHMCAHIFQLAWQARWTTHCRWPDAAYPLSPPITAAYPHRSAHTSRMSTPGTAGPGVCNRSAEYGDSNSSRTATRGMRYNGMHDRSVGRREHVWVVGMCRRLAAWQCSGVLASRGKFCNNCSRIDRRMCGWVHAHSTARYRRHSQLSGMQALIRTHTNTPHIKPTTRLPSARNPIRSADTNVFWK